MNGYSEALSRAKGFGDIANTLWPMRILANEHYFNTIFEIADDYEFGIYRFELFQMHKAILEHMNQFQIDRYVIQIIKE